MTYKQQKVKLRLCEHLRVQAPHLFTRTSANVGESALVMGHTPQMSSYPVDIPYQTQNKQVFDNNRNVEYVDNQKLDVLWKGKLARNGKKIIETVAMKISGQSSNILNDKLDIINITHRLKWEEASKNVPISVFSLHPSTKVDAFAEYIEYFKAKDRIGVSPLGDEYSIYVCAPGNPLYDKHVPDDVNTPILIGIIVSNNVSNVTQSNKPANERVDDWLNKLNNITAMLGTKK